MQQPICLAREFDLNKDWNEYIINSIFLQERSPVDVLAYAKVWMPW